MSSHHIQNGQHSFQQHNLHSKNIQQQQNQVDNPQDYQDNNQQNQRNYKQVLIKLSDLGPQQQCAIISISNAAIQQIADVTNIFETQKFSKIAGIIKRQLDQKFNNGWYVIVGKNFGTYVTHQKGTFMHFTFDDIHVCVFRAR